MPALVATGRAVNTEAVGCGGGGEGRRRSCRVSLVKGVAVVCPACVTVAGVGGKGGGWNVESVEREEQGSHALKALTERGM